jgi:hypothetical protein
VVAFLIVGGWVEPSRHLNAVLNTLFLISGFLPGSERNVKQNKNRIQDRDGIVPNIPHHKNIRKSGRIKDQSRRLRCLSQPHTIGTCNIQKLLDHERLIFLLSLP